MRYCYDFQQHHLFQDLPNSWKLHFLRPCWGSLLGFVRWLLLKNRNTVSLENYVRHLGKLICQRNWLRKEHNKFYRKSRRQKYLFFSRLKRDLFFNFCVCHKKRYIRKISHSWKQCICMFSLKALSGKWTVTGTCVFSSICVKLLNIKNNNFEYVPYPMQSEEKKII